MSNSVTNFTLADLQLEVEAWTKHNFPNKHKYQPLLGAMEELGELAHAHLKSEQNIRSGRDAFRAEAFDAIGDIVIYLADYCNQNNFSFELCMFTTWQKVKKRDWIKYPKNGMTE